MLYQHNRRFTITQDGKQVRSTWVKDYWVKGNLRRMYMADGSVFSVSTMQQMPYALHKGVKAIEIK